MLSALYFMHVVSFCFVFQGFQGCVGTKIVPTGPQELQTVQKDWKQLSKQVGVYIYVGST